METFKVDRPLHPALPVLGSCHLFGTNCVPDPGPGTLHESLLRATAALHGWHISVTERWEEAGLEPQPLAQQH